MTESDPLWRPAPARAASSHLARFAALARVRHGLSASDYADLHRWSVTAPEQFWGLVWDYCGVRATTPPEQVLRDGGRLPGARWFEGAELNFAANLLWRRDDHPALVARGEDSRRRVVTYAELVAQVAACAAGLRALGVGPGDRVAGLMPNIPETIVAALGAIATGATWTSAAPEFGPDAIVDRFGQVEPKVLVTVNGYRYNGRRHVLDAKVAAVTQRLPGLAAVLVVDDGGGSALAAERSRDWAAFLAAQAGAPPEFAPMPFAHPLYILYSSGTTGAPKCIVHGAGGTLLQHLKEHQLNCDLHAHDVLFWFTTCGWMMWNWLVSGLATGATLVLFDGNPMAPGPAVLWDMADEEGVTIFGTSAKYLSGIEKSGLKPRQTQRLDSVRTLLSTGSTLLPPQFDWVYANVKSDVHLGSVSGGTDIIGCFVGCNPFDPVYRGEIQGPALGMDVRVYDEDGRELERGTGELVCLRPFPSTPIGFWNDPGDVKYRKAYFEHFPGIWAHGDFAERTAHGWLIHGRSDATLNAGGVRIGTAEIYRQVERIDDIVESLVIGQEWEGDTRLVLFVRLQEGLQLDDGLRERIRRVLRENASPRHVPARIVQVVDIPRTMSGKITELAVRDIVHGREVKNRDALANPQSLELYTDLPELRS